VWQEGAGVLCCGESQRAFHSRACAFHTSKVENSTHHELAHDGDYMMHLLQVYAVVEIGRASNLATRRHQHHQERAGLNFEHELRVFLSIQFSQWEADPQRPTLVEFKSRTVHRLLLIYTTFSTCTLHTESNIQSPHAIFRG